MLKGGSDRWARRLVQLHLHRTKDRNTSAKRSIVFDPPGRGFRVAGKVEEGLRTEPVEEQGKFSVPGHVTIDVESIGPSERFEPVRVIDHVELLFIDGIARPINQGQIGGEEALRRITELGRWPHDERPAQVLAQVHEMGVGCDHVPLKPVAGRGFLRVFWPVVGPDGFVGIPLGIPMLRAGTVILLARIGVGIEQVPRLAPSVLVLQRVDVIGRIALRAGQPLFIVERVEIVARVDRA